MAQESYTLLEKFLFPYWPLKVGSIRQKLQNKTILITGASYGIGEALVHQLAQLSVRLILVARTRAKLIELQQQLSSPTTHIAIYALDLRKPLARQQFLLQLASEHPPIDILVSNAGKSIRRSIFDSLDRYHDFQRCMDINYHAPVELILSLIPQLVQQKGQLINISAINVLLVPSPKWAAYQSSKTAFDQWFRCIAPELEANGVRCSSIYLPLVHTRMMAPTKAYEKMPAMQPAHVASILTRCMAKRKRRFAPWWLYCARWANWLAGNLWIRLQKNSLRKKDL